MDRHVRPLSRPPSRVRPRAPSRVPSRVRLPVPADGGEMSAEERPAQPEVALLTDDGILDLLRTSRRIAVVGASSNPARPSFGVFQTLVAAGYECIPVNPNETEVAGVPALPTLKEAARVGPIDIVDVFRRSELTPEIARATV